LTNTDSISAPILVRDNAYQAGETTFILVPKAEKTLLIRTEKNYGWYDFSVFITGDKSFERRFAGRAEFGAPSRTDPYMGRELSSFTG
jgi:phospholipase C